MTIKKEEREEFVDINTLRKKFPENTVKLLDNIAEAIIGDRVPLEGPFGPRSSFYYDYVASGKGLTFIEDYIRDNILPNYANTHSAGSRTGLQTGYFREEARDIIKKAVNASNVEATKDVLIFSGSGCTGAIAKLVQILQLNDRDQFPNRDEPPVVLVSPYEHHSNILPWRESLAEVVNIKEDEYGAIDMEHLEALLRKYQNRPLVCVTVSAASNVTGIVVDTIAVSALTHKYGGLAFFDYAAGAPYMNINMNPLVEGEKKTLIHKDAIFFSPHKFIGGIDTPGVLVIKKRLIKSRIPTQPGGGTVFFVTSKDQEYLNDVENREEGGTPLIIGSIRAGLAFQLKQSR